MTIEKARELLWKDFEFMSDGEIQNYINYIDAVCTFVVDEYIKEKISEPEKNVQ